MAEANSKSNGRNPIRILIVDNQRMMRTALKTLIETHEGMTVVGETSWGSEAIDVTSIEQPDIVLLSLQPGNGNSEEMSFIPSLHAAASCARVLLLTSAPDPQIDTQALLLGAVGVLVKEQPAAVLVKALEKVSEGEAWIDRATMANLLNELSHRNGTADVDGDAAKIAALTEREKQVVALLSEGLKNQEIARRLFISESTVRHHLSSIFSKLGVKSRLDLVVYANRQGLINLRSQARGAV
jgi:DNA-binding NarL/FixJ family response regulator